MHPIFASLETANPKSIGEFINVMVMQVKHAAQQAIDTPEERASIEKAVMAYYDQYISALVPEVMRASFREGIAKGLDAALVAASTL